MRQERAQNFAITRDAALWAPVQAHVEARARALETLHAVRISEPERRLKQYPHELSGGMRQRVMIAMAILCRPDLLIADEPTTALDVTVQAQIMALLADLQREFGMATILITHDMGAIGEMADRLGVSRGSVSGWERRKHYPHHKNLRDYATVTGVPLWWLLAEDPGRPDAPHTHEKITRGGGLAGSKLDGGRCQNGHVHRNNDGGRYCAYLSPASARPGSAPHHHSRLHLMAVTPTGRHRRRPSRLVH